MSMEVQITTPSFPNSDGCMLVPNRKRLEPFTRGAMDGGRTRQRNSVAMVSHISGHAHSWYFSASIFAAMANATTPASTPVAWRAT